MKDCPFDNVTFVKGNCLDRKDPVLLRGCFRPDCKAACAKLPLYILIFASRGCHNLRNRPTNSSLHLSVHIRGLRHTLKTRIYQSLIALTDFSTLRGNK